MKYILKFPKNFDSSKKYPLIIYLHGAGSRGTDTRVLEEAAIFRYMNKCADFPAVVFAPLCSADTWFDVFEQLLALIDTAVSLPFADKERISLTGVSMGGYAAWQVLMSRNELFSAGVVCCGGGMYWNVERLKRIPVKVFHGAKDDAVYLSESVNMTEAINRAGGRAELTVFPDCAHNCWDKVYSDAEAYRFLCKKRKD